MNQAANGAFVMARGIAFLTASSDDDFRRMLQSIAAVQGAFDFFRGTRDVVQGVTRSISALRTASQAAAATSTALAASNAAVASSGTAAAGGAAAMSAALGPVGLAVAGITAGVGALALAWEFFDSAGDPIDELFEKMRDHEDLIQRISEATEELNLEATIRRETVRSQDRILRLRGNEEQVAQLTERIEDNTALAARQRGGVEDLELKFTKKSGARNQAELELKQFKDRAQELRARGVNIDEDQVKNEIKDRKGRILRLTKETKAALDELNAARNLEKKTVDQILEDKIRKRGLQENIARDRDQEEKAAQRIAEAEQKRAQRQEERKRREQERLARQQQAANAALASVAPEDFSAALSLLPRVEQGQASQEEIEFVRQNAPVPGVQRVVAEQQAAIASERREELAGVLGPRAVSSAPVSVAQEIAREQQTAQEKLVQTQKEAGNKQVEAINQFGDALLENAEEFADGLLGLSSRFSSLSRAMIESERRRGPALEKRVTELEQARRNDTD